MAIPKEPEGGGRTNPLLIIDKTTQLKTKAPVGFEDLDSSVHTLFDIEFQGQTVGQFDAVFTHGQITFSDPAKVAAALGDRVIPAQVIALLSKPLSANEQFRCRPGQSPNVGCGLLPAGTSGVIVSIETFSASLFLGREYLANLDTGPKLLGPATAGPSLIQGAQFSLSSNGKSAVHYGGTFDTLASIGATAVIAQTSLTDQDGFRSQQVYAQHIWSDRRAAVGILQDFQSLTFANYRVLGAEFGSFFNTYLDAENDTATPIQVVLPRRAQVEIYRDGVLILTGQYEAGLQLLDTHALPSGSYSIRVVARDGSIVLLDERRSFTKMGNLAPPGKVGFQLRVGRRVQDSFLTDSTSGRSPGFFPSTTGETVVSASAQKRLGSGLASSVSATSFDSRVFAESSLQVFRGRFQGLVGVGAGSNGAISGIVSATLQLPNYSFYLSARSTHSNETVGTVPAGSNRYLPFFRTEDSVFGSVQTHLLGGSFSVSGSYTRSPNTANQYTIGTQYTRSMRMPLIGLALLSADGSVSELDKRFGITISFFKQIDRKTDVSFTAGGQYVHDSGGGSRSGFSPEAEAVITRSDRIGPVDVVGQLGGSTDADSDRIFSEVRAMSTLGSIDGTAQYQTHTGGSSNNMSFIMNAQTGFAVGGGRVKIGLRNPADAMVLIDLKSTKANPPKADAYGPPDDRSHEAPAQRDAAEIAEGGYRINVNAHPLDYVEPGRLVAVGLPSLKQYSVSLRPEGAPQFDLDTTQRQVTLYPGNVVRLQFKARQVVSVFGQVVDAAGKGVGNARAEAGSDYAVTDDQGYFTITAPTNADLTIKTAGGVTCITRNMGTLIAGRPLSVLYRLGKLSCTIQGKSVSQAQPVAVPEPVPQRVSQVLPLAPMARQPLPMGAASPIVPSEGARLTPATTSAPHVVPGTVDKPIAFGPAGDRAVSLLRLARVAIEAV